MTHAPLTKQYSSQNNRTKSIAIEGWRGINHSFALVNQHQILELLRLDGLRLFHTDLPFAFAHWTREANASGFEQEQQQVVDALPSPEGELVDCIYRIGSPFRAGTDYDRQKTVTFMVTELGLSDSSFEGGRAAMPFFTRNDNAITTPSSWSHARLVDWGFEAEKITVIPHGVDCAKFGPLDPVSRQANRRVLGIGDDETLFLNIGLSSWNKGIDLLLIAFAVLRSAGRKVRLILKDQRDLYGRSVETMIRELGVSHPVLIQADTLSAIAVISTNIGLGELRALFDAADCYVSPYRAEGFNLPVLEAIACGTPVIVTKGGATDDFCNDDVALRISGTPNCHSEASTGYVGQYIEPNLPELISAMECFAANGYACLKGFESGRIQIVNQFTWQNAAKKLATLTVDLDQRSADLDHENSLSLISGIEISLSNNHPTNQKIISAVDNGSYTDLQDQNTINIHQIYITDDDAKESGMPKVFRENHEILKVVYPNSNIKVWNLDMLRYFINQNFDRDVLLAFDMLQPYAFKADLGRLCLLYLYGGLYVDVAIRFLNALNPPSDVGIATFAGPWSGSPTWIAMTNGIIWSKPKRREMQLAIGYIVENCRTRYYGKNCLYPTGPVCLGRAFASALAERLDSGVIDDQWVGIQRAATPEFDQKNWCFVAPDSSITAISIKKYASDLSHLDAKGTNSYFKIWCEKNVYGELNSV